MLGGEWSVKGSDFVAFLTFGVKLTKKSIHRSKQHFLSAVVISVKLCTDVNTVIFHNIVLSC